MIVRVGGVKFDWRPGLLLGCLAMITFAIAAEPPKTLAPGSNTTTKYGVGDHVRKLTVDGRQRQYLMHVPPGYSARTPIPVVLAFHGAGMNGAWMVHFSGLNKTADKQRFVVVYPDGTGRGPLLVYNAGGVSKAWAENRPNDVAFTKALLDDLEQCITVDSRRIYATGLSNGGMMCYRLAIELSDRLAAVAPVAGTMTEVPAQPPPRPMPILHFHGTADGIVPLHGPTPRARRHVTFLSVADTLKHWREWNRCADVATITSLPDKEKDGTTVTRTCYGHKGLGSEVEYVEIEGGGHTWPGTPPPVPFIGKSTRDISANDVMWEFFQRHTRQ